MWRDRQLTPPWLAVSVAVHARTWLSYHGWLLAFQHGACLTRVHTFQRTHLHLRTLFYILTALDLRTKFNRV